MSTFFARIDEDIMYLGLTEALLASYQVEVKTWARNRLEYRFHFKYGVTEILIRINPDTTYRFPKNKPEIIKKLVLVMLPKCENCNVTYSNKIIKRSFCLPGNTSPESFYIQLNELLLRARTDMLESLPEESASEDTD